MQFILYYNILGPNTQLMLIVNPNVRLFVDNILVGWLARNPNSVCFLDDNRCIQHTITPRNETRKEFSVYRWNFGPLLQTLTVSLFLSLFFSISLSFLLLLSFYVCVWKCFVFWTFYRLFSHGNCIFCGLLWWNQFSFQNIFAILCYSFITLFQQFQSLPFYKD